MTLYETLQTARSEEDVKDLYIQALGLERVHKGTIDIQTDEIWFEAKEGDGTSVYAMFTQLLFYVQKALKNGEDIPPFLCVVDASKAAFMETKKVLPFLNSTRVKWGKSGSDVTYEALTTVSQFIGPLFVSFRLETQENEFIQMVQTAIKTGEIVRTQITPNNLKRVFDKWCEMIGAEIEGVSPDDYALLFFADIMSDGTEPTYDLPAELIIKNKQPAFIMRSESGYSVVHALKSHIGYQKFWSFYHRPPKDEYRNYLLERRDSLIPTDARSFTGAYYTPLHIVEKAYELLDQTLGPDWQREYFLWDMCCGVGNLETKHANHRNIAMSTLDQADVDVMVAARTCVRAERFQYDYLNDDVTEDGEIDYTLTNKVPQSLRNAIQSGKKILILMNPPYAEATNADNPSKGAGAKNKTGVAKTRWAKYGMGDRYGKATNELFTQFITRIGKEMPNAVIAMFSKLKHINSQNFEKFRSLWNAQYLGGFIVHSKAFDGLKGNFPIGFLVWQTRQKARIKTPITEITCEVIAKDGTPKGEKKFFNLPSSRFLNAWIPRPSCNRTAVIPLSNAVTPTAMEVPCVKTWSENALAYMCAGTNDVQNAGKYTFLLSSVAGRGHGFYVTQKNLWKAAVVFTVQRIVRKTWVNDRDQFLQPSKKLSKEFKNDCLIWMLFNGSNLTASANDLKWDGKSWSIVNHFIPYTEPEVNAPGRFESDFMVNYLNENQPFSAEAWAVLDAGRELWRAYFAYTDPAAVREELKLNRPDVGWYQIRKALEYRNAAGDLPPVSFTAFEEAYASLTEKLYPMVYDLGFLI